MPINDFISLRRTIMYLYRVYETYASHAKPIFATCNALMVLQSATQGCHVEIFNIDDDCVDDNYHVDHTLILMREPGYDYINDMPFCGFVKWYERHVGKIVMTVVRVYLAGDIWSGRIMFEWQNDEHVDHDIEIDIARSFENNPANLAFLKTRTAIDDGIYLAINGADYVWSTKKDFAAKSA